LTAKFARSTEARDVLGESHANLGEALRHAGELDEAEAEARKGLALREQSLAEYPRVAHSRWMVAQSCISLGALLWQRGRLEEAETCIRRAVALSGSLAEEFEDVPSYTAQLRMTRRLLVRVACARSRPGQA